MPFVWGVMSEPPPTPERLREEILRARRRIYAFHGPTPLDELPLDGAIGTRLFLKREDLGPIHAYKWRGACNRMAMLDADERARGVVTASAGNHAQGVALAARKLGTTAKIFMPVTTPLTKQRAVAHHGGDAVTIVLTGDTYDVAREAADAEIQKHGCTYIEAFNDLAVIGGQGTLADEIVMSGQGPFDRAYLQIGGGGMAAGVACWLKFYYPGIEIVGVEGEGQASMAAAVAAGKPVSLDSCDVFSDGTAVRQAGSRTFVLCRELIDRFITVSNGELCGAIQYLWDKRRVILEPAGAMGLAGVLKEQAGLEGQKVIAVACGANMDFGQLPLVARRASIGGHARRFLRVEIPERKGALLDFLNHCGEEANIIEFQYGKTKPDIAHYTIGFTASEEALTRLEAGITAQGYRFTDVSRDEDVAFRMIHFDPAVVHLPRFVRVDFHERTGSLRALLEQVRGFANICYFNYTYSGERVGRALIGFEFETVADRERLAEALNRTDGAYRDWRPVPPHVMERVLS